MRYVHNVIVMVRTMIKARKVGSLVMDEIIKKLASRS